jgi:hypothetical protein
MKAFVLVVCFVLAVAVRLYSPCWRRPVVATMQGLLAFNVQQPFRAKISEAFEGERNQVTHNHLYLLWRSRFVPVGWVGDEKSPSVSSQPTVEGAYASPVTPRPDESKKFAPRPLPAWYRERQCPLRWSLMSSLQV